MFVGEGSRAGKEGAGIKEGGWILVGAGRLSKSIFRDTITLALKV